MQLPEAWLPGHPIWKINFQKKLLGIIEGGPVF